MRRLLIPLALVVASVNAACWGIGADDRSPAPTPAGTPSNYLDRPLRAPIAEGYAVSTRTPLDFIALQEYVQSLRGEPEYMADLDAAAASVGFRLLEPSDRYQQVLVTVRNGTLSRSVVVTIEDGSRELRFAQEISTLFGSDYDEPHTGGLRAVVEGFDVTFWSDDAATHARFVTGEELYGEPIIATITADPEVHVVELKEFIETLEFVGD